MSEVETVAKARELAEKAASGPWEFHLSSTGISWLIDSPDENGALAAVRRREWRNDAAFIAASRELVPQLCDIIERLREEKAEMLEIIRRIPKTGLDEINAELRSQLIMVMSERDVARAALAQVNEELEGFDIPADYDDTPATRAKWAAISLRGFMQDS